MSILSGLKDLVETAGSIYLQKETIGASNGVGGSNSGSDHPYVQTGTDNQGNTLIERQLLPGVSNGMLLLSVVGVLVVGGMTAAIVFD